MGNSIADDIQRLRNDEDRWAAFLTWWDEDWSWDGLPAKLQLRTQDQEAAIQAARALLRWSQQDLADKAIVSINAVTRLERDEVDRPGEPKALTAVLNVVKSSPQAGTIRVLVKPTKEMKVGDSVELKASLSSPNGQLEQVFLVKITDPEKKAKDPKPGDEPDKRLGLPKPVMVYKDTGRGGPTWDELEARGITMDHEVVVHAQLEGEALSEICINMDSSALLNYRAKLNKEEAIAVADKRYLSAVYFHTLFDAMSGCRCRRTEL